MIRIAVDVYGGDNAPGCVIDGALEALRAMDDVSILFCGAQAEVEGLLNGREYDAQRVSIVDAPDIITNHESPTLAIRRKLIFDVTQKSSDIARRNCGCHSIVISGDHRC